MKYRRRDLERDAKRIMGMSGVTVYECRRIEDHCFDVVWRGSRRCSLPFPWDVNKGMLWKVGMSLRNRDEEEKRFEKALTASQRFEEERERDNESDKEVMVRDVMRTVDVKPLYFY